VASATKEMSADHCCCWLAGKHVVFGEVTSGTELVQLMESLGSSEGETSKKVVISNCGELLPGQEVGAVVDGFALFPGLSAQSFRQNSMHARRD
jgi:hypothetical protein